MRGKRSSAPVAEYQWGASILPGGPPPQPPTPPAAAAPPQNSAPPEYAAPPQYAAAPQYAPPPAPHQFSAPPQPFAPPAPTAVPSRFGNTPELGGGLEAPSTQRLGQPADFAASTVSAPQYEPPLVGRFGAPPVGAPPFGNPQFGNPQFGTTPPPFGAPPGLYPGAPVYGPPARAGLPVAARIALGIVGGFIALAILVAIAIPVFLSQHQKPANRAVDVPATLLGLPQMHTSQLDDFNAQAVSAMTVPGAHYENVTSGFFGEGSLPVYFVVAAKLTVRPTQHDEATYLAAAAYGAGIALASVAPGPYGGKMQCGAATSTNGIPATECYAVDDAAILLITVFQSSETDAELLARQIIGAVEH